MIKEYPAIVHKQEKSDYGVSFPDFPGCITAGKTLQKAHAMACKALQAHVELMMEEGITIPKPSTLDAAARHENADSGCVLMLVPADVSGRKERINITMRSDVLHQIDQVTKNRSGWLEEAAIKELSYLSNN